MSYYPTLFPAYAGVIPKQLHVPLIYLAFPRIRGGDPLGEQAVLNQEIFSPHTRG